MFFLPKLPRKSKVKVTPCRWSVAACAGGVIDDALQLEIVTLTITREKALISQKMYIAILGFGYISSLDRTTHP